jgi:hypothetical protein
MQQRPAVNRLQMSRPWPYSRPLQQSVFMAREADVKATAVQRVATIEANGTFMIASGATQGTEAGTTFIVTGQFSGTPTFVLTDAADNRFQLDGNKLEAGLVATDYETAQSHNITVDVTGVIPNPPARTFTINVQPA